LEIEKEQTEERFVPANEIAVTSKNCGGRVLRNSREQEVTVMENMG
jgi:hypothetical protein